MDGIMLVLVRFVALGPSYQSRILGAAAFLDQSMHSLGVMGRH